MPLVDSNQEQLSGPEVIAMSVEEFNETEYPPAVVLASIADETTKDNTDLVQIGNTVFLAHRGTGKDKNKMVGRAFNIDTGRNFVKNGFKYFTYLQNKGITHYTTQFSGDIFLNAFRAFHRRTIDSDTKIAVGRTASGKHVVYMRLGKEPLERGL